ncbi:ABC transporter substrate-binding protein [Microvirga arabica]|uniref:ABC transporter substrate-binding protein n=1 Tax=Microvirga arabica TaxID=1128671 RepID=UPI001939B3B2|nr:ABC transporter substrate-binding protein [Microvirga arabica]MBM1173832.1 ABC transporter substrate-binding protein [Microvirga arabica]
MTSASPSLAHVQDEGHQSRRQVLKSLAGLASLPFLTRIGSASAQASLPRIGFLSVPPQGHSPVFGAFQEGLHSRGYVPGQNAVLEWRGAEGKDERLPQLATELVNSGVNVIVAETYPAIVAARNATGTVPIVMAVSSDPVETGLVESLSRPGGNITGLTTLSTHLNGKRLQLLKEAFPGMRRLALVWASLAAPDKAPGIRETQRVAQELGLEIQYFEIRKSDDWEEAIRAVAKAPTPPDTVFQLCDPVTLSRRKALVDFAARTGLPSMYEMREYVIEGGLMAYGPSLATMGRRSADYVDRIMKGAKPSDLPVEQPIKLELAINQATARAINLDLPQSLLAWADELIE